MSDKTTVFVPGYVYWAKVVGDPVPNYEQTGREWTYEFEPDDVSFLKEHRLLDRLKDKEDPKNPDKGEYLVLRKPELNTDGEKNKPIPIYDSENEPWDGRLLGNRTRVIAKLQIVDWGKGKKQSIWTQAIRVEELVPYEGGNAFAAFDEENGKPAKKPSTKAKAKEEFEDDIPF